MQVHIRILTVATGVTVALTTLALPAQADAGGRVVDLGIAECARDVNDLGVVVTDTQVWERGRVTPLPGGLDSAVQINDRGQVAGTDAGVAALWDGQQLVRIGLADPADTSSYATGLNELGQVTGVSYGPGGTTHAFVWSRGTLRALPGLGGDAGASDVNDLGVVAGYAWDGGTQRAVLWRADGTLVRLPSLGDGTGHSLATAVTNRGDAVGYAYSDGTMRAVRWPGGGAPRAIDPAGSVLALASDANGSGRAVGTAVPASGSQQGFVSDARGRTELVPLLVEGDTAVLNAVNLQGVAVGCEFGDDTTTAILYR